MIRDGNYQSLLDEPNGRIHHDEKFRERALRAVINARAIGMTVPTKLADDLGLPDVEPRRWSEDDQDLPTAEPIPPNPNVPEEDDDGRAPF